MLCNLQGGKGTCVENYEGASIKAQVEDDPKNDSGRSWEFRRALKNMSGLST